jgi:preprotein translocase subunit SecG
MSTLLTVLILIVCLMLILVVLVQNSKGGGIASNFAASNQVMGVQRTTEVIEKITWALVGALVVLSIITSFIHQGGVKPKDTELREKIQNAKAPAPASKLPAQPASPAPAPAPGK